MDHVIAICRRFMPSACQCKHFHGMHGRFSHRRLRLLRRWRMPKEAEIGEAGLPCERYSSDHLALCAVFELLPDDVQ